MWARHLSARSQRDAAQNPYERHVVSHGEDPPSASLKIPLSHVSAVSSAASALECASSFRVLLVEDDPLFVRFLRESLLTHSAELDVTVATRLSTAIAALKARAFDAVLLDLNLPAAGTGLGLMIAKELIEQAGGTIRVESQYGQGAAVRIELPQHA